MNLKEPREKRQYGKKAQLGGRGASGACAGGDGWVRGRPLLKGRRDLAGQKWGRRAFRSPCGGHRWCATRRLRGRREGLGRSQGHPSFYTMETMPRVPMVPSGPTLDPITSIYSFLPSRRVPSDHGEAAAEKSCPVNTQIFPTVFCHVQWDQAGRQGRAVRHEFSSSSALFKVPFVVNQRPSLTTSRARSTTAAAHRPRQPDPSVMPPPHQLTFMLGDHVSYVKLPPDPQATFYFA